MRDADRTREDLEAELERLRRREVEREAEIGALRARVEQLEGLSTKKEAAADLTNETVLRAFLEHTPVLMFVKDLEWRYILVNKHFEHFVGLTRDEIIGKKNEAFLTPEGVRASEASDRAALAEGTVHYLQVAPRSDGVLHYYQCVKFRITDEEGVVRGVGTVALDVTEERKRIEERSAREAEAIATQAALLRELASPLLPIAEHVVAMPLIGAIDEVRAQQITETLLQGVSEYNAHVAILDITWLRCVDGNVASALVNTAMAVKLLGAQAVVTGMRPAVAQALVDAGANLEGILTLATLRSGIAWAIQRGAAKSRLAP